MKTKRPYSRAQKIVGAFAWTLALTWACFSYVPLTFEVHKTAGRATWHGIPVVSHGYSRLSDRVHVNYHIGGGDQIFGRCFIEIKDRGETRRIYGWKLSRWQSPPRDVERSGMRWKAGPVPVRKLEIGSAGRAFWMEDLRAPHETQPGLYKTESEN